jgi:hypothetical protein
MSCVTHHACDCIQAENTALKAELETLRAQTSPEAKSVLDAAMNYCDRLLAGFGYKFTRLRDAVTKYIATLQNS